MTLRTRGALVLAFAVLASSSAAFAIDTDGDGVTDDVELAEGTNPLDRLDVPETPVPEFDQGGVVVLVLAFTLVVVRRLRALELMATW